MFGTPLKNLVTGSLIALSSASLVQEGYSQENTKRPVLEKGDTPERDGAPPPLPVKIQKEDDSDPATPDQRSDADLTAAVLTRLDTIQKRISREACDISEDLHQLDAYIEKNADHSRCQGVSVIYNIEKELDAIASSCATYLNSDQPDVLTTITSNFQALTSGFVHSNSHYAKGAAGLFEGGHIEAMLEEISADDRLNRARLTAALGILTCYRGDIPESPILALTGYLPRLSTAEATSPETRGALPQAIEKACTIFQHEILNSTPELLGPHTQLISTYHELLAAAPAEPATYRRAVHALELFTGIDPALRYDTQHRDLEEFDQLVSSMVELYRFSLSGAPHISDPREQDFLRQAAFSGLKYVNTLEPEHQDLFVDVLAEHYLRKEQGDLESVLTCTRCIQVRSFGSELRERSNWDNYALYKILNEERSYFESALEALEDVALTSEDPRKQTEALNQLAELEGFLTSVQSFDAPHRLFEGDSQHQLLVAGHRASAAEWLNRRRAYPIAVEYIQERDLGHTKAGRTPYSEQTNFRVSDIIERIVSAELTRQPELRADFLTLMQATLSNDDSAARRTAIHRLLRAPVESCTASDDLAAQFSKIVRAQVARDQSALTLLQLGQTLGVWCFNAENRAEEGRKKSSWQSQASSRREKELSVKAGSVLAHLHSYTDTANQHLPGSKGAQNNPDSLQALFVDLLSVVDGDLAASLSFLNEDNPSAVDLKDKDTLQRITRIRHNAALVLTGAGLSLPEGSSSRMLSDLLEANLENASSAEDLGERIGALYMLYTHSADIPNHELQIALADKGQQLRGLLFDGATRLHTENGRTTSYQIAPIVDSLAMQSALMDSSSNPALRRDLMEDAEAAFNSPELQRTKLLMRLQSTESFLRSTPEIDFGERVQFLKAMGISGSDATDPATTLKLLQYDR